MCSFGMKSPFLLLACLISLTAQAQPAANADLFAEELFEESAPETADSQPSSAPANEPKPSAQTRWLPNLTGQGGLEYRFFHDRGEDRGMDYHHNFSFHLEPKLQSAWDGNRQKVSVQPFWRHDQNDPRRTHFDLRELVWRFSRGPVTFHVGIDKVFWGVAESRHTVDIINQTDLIENSDTEDKLGQPMLRLDYADPRWGNLSLFYLPVSRLRTFPGKHGRLRPPLPITASAERLGNARTTHPDFALRWTRTFGYWDVGIAYFHGVTREPRFRIGFDRQFRPTKLTPVYEVIDQLGLDIQGVTGNFLWKLEGFHRAGQGQSFQQLTAGFEYTFSSVFETGADLGLLLEFLYDNRQDRLPQVNFIPFEKDLFAGTRLALNDVASTELLAGAIVDFDTATTAYNIEASRRFGEHWKLYLEIRGFVNTDPQDAGFFFRRENYLQLELQYYF